MSGTYQKTLIVGRLGRDPELRYTQSGTPVARLSLATSETYTDGQGERQERTEWHRVVAWGKTGETAAQHLAKGRLALVEGRLQTRSWQDQQGVKRYVTEIRADRVVFMPDGKGQGGVPPPDDADAPAGGYGPAFPSSSGGMDDAPF
jgi:single-strand DNA-binding protein